MEIHEERFMEGTEDWLSNLKLRASWGKAGNNQGIGNYAWQAVYATQNVVVDGSGSKGLYISSLSNADLKWETTATTDIGLDMGFFDNRLTAEIDYYRKNTTDILYTPTIYMTMGEVSGVPSNLGSVVNKGVELALNWKSRIGKDFSYYAGVNFSYNKTGSPGSRAIWSKRGPTGSTPTTSPTSRPATAAASCARGTLWASTTSGGSTRATDAVTGAAPSTSMPDRRTA